MRQSSVFRKVALERLASPEQLDALLTVAGARSWLVLAAMIILLATAVYWGIMGSIPVHVTAPTILHNSGGIQRIITTKSGQLTALYIKAGDTIAVGAPLAEITPLDGDQPQTLVSAQAGRVLELKTAVGDLVTPGNTLANTELVGEDITLEATLYIPPESSHQVAIGMPVKITTQSGTNLDGIVSFVGDFPASHEAIIKRLGNENLVESLLTSNTPIEVHVQIDATKDQLAANGIKTGTLADASILVDSRRPIELVIPVRLGSEGG